MSTYMLVHGAWHGAWCWEQVVPLLQAGGHTVITPDLPGHGQDKTPIKQITLQSYIDCIGKLLKPDEPIILVGHSMAGIIISQVAELFPDSIKCLVYLAAFLPKNGESMFQIANKQPITRFVKMMKPLPEENAFQFPFSAMKDFAYHQSSLALVEKLQPRFCVEPLLPLTTAVQLSARFGKISRIYIECLEDKAVLLQTQRNMQYDCQRYSLNSDHSPFYSNSQALVTLLEKLV
ncbi:MAG: alpha/beta fold hydrolase [Proteobacteria bacterium]|nr:alpha/beta fold hydrolase [Pseudomonadota bacterium]